LVLMRLIPLAAQRVGSVVVSCPEAWLPLLAAVPGMPDLRSARDAPPDCDLEAELDDLPALLGLSAAGIPPPPYLDPLALVPSARRSEPSPGIGVAFEPAPAARCDASAAAQSEGRLQALLSVLKT